ncbi:zinc finger, SWIM-type containing protein [Tanacetum coccineum]
MMTSSTRSLLPANSPTTNLPPATSTTTNLPPATSTTSHLLLATSTTSHLPPATSTTSHLPPVTSSTSHLLPSTSTARACNINEADLFVVLVAGEENLLIEAEIKELDDFTINEDVEANVILEPVKINTPRPSLYLHNETPRGTTYWEPNVDKPYLPLEGKRFDTIEECVEFYSVYAKKGGFEVKKSAQKKTKSGMVKSKYVMCNRERVPKEISNNTLDPQNSDKQIRNTRYRITGGTQYVHGTSDDFKNHIRDVNAFIGESDAQMLINKMENRKKFVPNFMFYYLVENSELVAMFWADEVAKCNYKEFGDIISFDATFRTNKQCYRQVVLDFRTFDSAPKLHTKLTIEIHACKVYTRTISLLVQKEIYEGVWACQIQDFKKEEGCEIVKVRDIRAGAYRTLYTEEGKETVIQEKDKEVDYKVVRNPEDGSVECTCRHFLRYGFLCRHVFCVLKNCNIGVIPERYILRRWRRDLIPPALRRNTNRYGEKDEAIEKLTNEANYVVDECLFLLRKDEEQLKQFVEKLENIKKEIQVKLPNPPSQKTGDVIEDIYAIKKPNQNLVNNPQKASNKGGRRGERRKSGREIAMKAKAKRARKCGYCAEITNKHTKTTCPLNPKYIAKLARTEAVAEQERRTAASATEQEERNSDTAHIVDKEQSNTAS